MPQLNDHITLRFDCKPLKRGNRCTVEAIFSRGRDRYMVKGPCGCKVLVPIEAIEKEDG